MKYIIFNPKYSLKPDKTKVLLMPRYHGRNLIKGVDDSSFYVLHPIFAMILSFINGRDFITCIRDASSYLNISFDLVKGFVEKLIDNPNKILIKFGDMENSMFLPNTIISKDEECIQERYLPESFDYDNLELKLDRHHTPTKLTLMFNNICYTDCIYCYEDKSIKADCQIPFNRILELIHEARKLNVESFDVIGGEFFLYSKWRDVLSELQKYGYNPFLSTKMPLEEDDVKFLADLDILDIQVSLDSAIEEHLVSSIKIKKGYIQKMKNFLFLLNKYNIPVLIHTVLTRFNSSIDDMKSIYNILKDFNNIQIWHVVKGESTLYPRTEYKKIEIDNYTMSEISCYLNKISIEGNIPIRNQVSEALEQKNKEVSSYLETSKRKQKIFFSQDHIVADYSLHYIFSQMVELQFVSNYIGIIRDLLLEMFCKIA